MTQIDHPIAEQMEVLFERRNHEYWRQRLHIPEVER